MNRRRALAFLTPLFVASPPRPAGAGEVPFPPGRVDITSTTHSGWHTDSGYGELFERLNVATGTGAWQLGLRLDTATFASAPPMVTGRYDLEKISLSYAGRSLEIIAGDSYLSIGRGLALSLRKLDELGIDTTLQGAKLLVHEGDFGGTLAFGFANIVNVDEATGKSVDDPHDLVGAIQSQMLVGDLATLGAHATMVAFHDSIGLVPVDRYSDRYIQFGPTIDAPHLLDWLGVYLEGIGQLRHTLPEGDAAPAFGMYATATAFLDPATILFEGKAYGPIAPIKPKLGLTEFDTVAYNNPPTCERILQIIENPQEDIAGGRFRFDWAFGPDLLAFVNYGIFRDWQGYDDPHHVGTTLPGTINDPYAGFEVRWNDERSFATAQFGWRTVFIGKDNTLVRGDAHFDGSATQALGGPWSMTLHVLHTERKKFESVILDEQFREGTILLGVRYRPWFGASAGYDYTTDPTQPKRDYFNGSLEWNITPSSSLRLFGGGTRGGLRCVSGVCRVFPPFEGVKLIATLRY